MLSRIIAIVLCAAFFLSSFYLVVFADPQLFSFKAKEDEITTSVDTDEPTVVMSFKDLDYGKHERETLDLSFPKGTGRDVGLLLYIHGGGWTSGDKTDFRHVQSLFTENEDYAVASMNYRYAVADEYDTYDIIDDITSALSCIKETAAKNGVNINKVILCGYSAGAHLSLLYAYRYRSVSPISVSAVFALSSVSDFTLEEFYQNNRLGNEKEMCEMMTKVTGKTITPETRKDNYEILSELSPVRYVNENTVETIIIHGKHDPIAPYKGSKLLAEKLNAYHVVYEFITLENSSHGLNGDKEIIEKAKDLMRERTQALFELN